ncbi:hypothetical protein B5X24_HaOG206647 [Helicoverpa armigera]|nr:hypothetical protein B5X24_HaOG206647 [Helicoverpa armigera]
MNNNNNRNNNNGNNNDPNPWVTAAAVGLTGALVAGAVYMFSGTRQPQQPSTQNRPRIEPSRSSPSRGSERPNDPSEAAVSSYLSDLLSRMSTSRGGSASNVTIEEIPNIPDNPNISNLNALLADIHVRYIKLTQFGIHYRVFDTIFQDLHKKMKEVDPYYRKYSSTVQFAGSHYDNLRIVKPDEFDMDIVIGLPLNIKTDPFNPAQSDIAIEPKAPGFVQLKMGVQFQRLPMRDNEEWLNNRAAYEWKDDSNYLLRSKFTDWFKSVVNKALNKFPMNINSRPIAYVEGVPYVIDKSESGPAFTLLISNASKSFKLDVDLVPCLKFPEDRWPISSSYREIPSRCKKDYWMVVGKPNKASPEVFDQMRSWRIALHNQERELMHNSYNMRQAIRFIKKLRDSLGMKKIASYYIKTLFFWEIEKINNSDYWQRNSPATLFKLMVGRLYEALVAGNIPYFWNKQNNLIGAVERKVLDDYKAKLQPLLAILEQPTQYKLVAKYLLTPAEFADYNARFLHI